MLHARIQQHQLIALRIEREVGILQRTAVQTDQVALLSENRGELVHDAAVYAAVVVFGRLADLRQFELVDTAVIEVVQRKGIGRLQRCRRRHAGAQGHVSGKHRVEAADLAAALLNLAADAEDVACPALGRFVRLVQTELRAFAQVERIGAHPVRAVEPDRCDNPLIDRPREDEAPVVVRVLADQVDAARRGEQDSSLAVKFVEFLADFFFHGSYFVVLSLSIRNRIARR